ncbi:MAG: YdcF family protein [Acetobacteraceae bacterium]|nr:YdcF family protein [Acetobacteraceae bacterium]
MSLTLAPRRLTRAPLRWRVLVALGCAALAWLGGFAWFLYRVGQPSAAPPPAEGIVALTGGAERVRAGLLLLADRRADRLLVTGIGGHAGFRDLARAAGLDPEPLADRVTLGSGAASTRGNAEETAAWARANGLHSLIVVTAAYHMPRALTEFGRALPGVALYPASVSPPRAGETLGSARLLAGEYTKYIGAALGLTALMPGPPPRLSPADARAP